MGRYRPPAPAKSKYITVAGKDRLQKEHDYLWKVKRPKVTRSVQEAAAQGDRSEMLNISMEKSSCVKLIIAYGIYKNV